MKKAIREELATYPVDIRSKPERDEMLNAFEADYEKIPADFHWFLATCGGGVVGCEWIDDLEKLRESHDTFRKQSQGPKGWTMQNVFIIGWDGGGNPIGIDRDSGKVFIEDHTFGGIHEEGESLGDYFMQLLFPEDDDE